MQCKQWSNDDASKFPAPMAMRIEFASQNINSYEIADFFFGFRPQLFSRSKHSVRKLIDAL